MKADLFSVFLISTVVAGCTSPPPLPPREAPPRDVSLAPDRDQVEGLLSPLDGDVVQPIVSQMLVVDLDTCLRLAGADSAEVERSRASLETLRTLATRSEMVFFPSLSLGGDFRRETGRLAGGKGGNSLDRRFSVTTLGATLRYALNPGAAWYDRAASFLRVEQGIARTEAERFRAELKAARFYVLLERAFARAALAADLLRSESEQLKLHQQLVETGLVAPEVAVDAELSVARRKKQQIEAERDARQASVSLAHVLRLDPVVTLSPTAPYLEALALVDPARDVNELLQIARDRRPELRSAALGLKVAEAEESASKWAAYFPTLSLSQFYGTTGRSGASSNLLGPGGFHPTSTFMLSAVETLSGDKIANINVQEARVNRAGLEPTLVEEAVRAQVVGALAASRDAQITIARSHGVVQVATKMRRAAQQKNEVGLGSGLGELIREEILVESRMKEIEAVARWNLAQIDLLFAIGVLGPAD